MLKNQRIFKKIKNKFFVMLLQTLKLNLFFYFEINLKNRI